mmetsp:Transcript_28248/g.79746  ORF Transcript_28248/g.79746 Transcript_28248/m.79746 type:complete len:218 (-) Transcript_28248:1262-1915(-)
MAAPPAVGLHCNRREVICHQLPLLPRSPGAGRGNRPGPPGYPRPGKPGPQRHRVRVWDRHVEDDGGPAGGGRIRLQQHRCPALRLAPGGGRPRAARPVPLPPPPEHRVPVQLPRRKGPLKPPFPLIQPPPPLSGSCPNTSPAHEEGHPPSCSAFAVTVSMMACQQANGSVPNGHTCIVCRSLLLFSFDWPPALPSNHPPRWPLVHPLSFRTRWSDCR